MVGFSSFPQIYFQKQRHNHFSPQASANVKDFSLPEIQKVFLNSHLLEPISFHHTFKYMQRLKPGAQNKMHTLQIVQG